MKVDLSQLLTLIGANTEFAKDITQVLQNATNDVAAECREAMTHTLCTLTKLTKVLAAEGYELVKEGSVAQALDELGVELPSELDEAERCHWDEEDPN